MLSGALVEARAEAGPRDEVTDGGKTRHVDADLGDDDVRERLTDARDRREQRVHLSTQAEPSPQPETHNG